MNFHLMTTIYMKTILDMIFHLKVAQNLIA